MASRSWCDRVSPLLASRSCSPLSGLWFLYSCVSPSMASRLRCGCVVARRVSPLLASRSRFSKFITGSSLPAPTRCPASRPYCCIFELELEELDELVELRIEDPGMVSSGSIVRDGSSIDGPRVESSIDGPGTVASGSIVPDGLSIEDPLVDSSTDEPGTVAFGSICLLYTSPSPRDRQKSRMPSSA